MQIRCFTTKTSKNLKNKIKCVQVANGRSKIGQKLFWINIKLFKIGKYGVNDRFRRKKTL